MSELESLLVSVVGLFAVALVVRLFVRRREGLSYASVLVAVGLFISVAGLSFDIELSTDLILAVLLPVVIFQGTTELDGRRLRHNAPLVAVLTLVGLPLAILVLGLAGSVAFGFPLLVALVFAAIILPTDPAAVLSLFEQFHVSERLAVMVEGESLLNDGVAIVIFTTLLAAVGAGGQGVGSATTGGLAALLTPAGAAGIVVDIAVIGGGGLLVGALVGLLAHQLMRRLTDRMTVVLLTVVVAYGSFLFAEDLLGLSGVLAVVGAGLLMGAHEETHEMIHASESFVMEVWSTASFLVTTALYVLIGSEVEVADFVRYADLVVLAAVLVLLARATTVYPLVSLTNRVTTDAVPRNYQHIMVWGGLHTVVPVALALSLPPSVPFRDEIQTMVFGVAVISIVVQGLLMPTALRVTGLAASMGPDSDER